MDSLISNGEDTRLYYKNIQLDSFFIPNAVDINKWASPKPKFTIPLQIAYIGRLSEVKGIVQFCDAVEHFSQDNNTNKVSFHIVGMGEQILQQRVESLHKRKLLNYHGAIPNCDLPQFLQKIHACVF